MDLNFDYHWGESGASDDACSDYYAGPRPFSEPETKAIADFFLQRRDEFLVFLTMHSYLQKWAIPWTYTHKKVSCANKVKTFA